MKKLYTFLTACLATLILNAQLINEFQPNPAGDDPATVDFEIVGSAGASFSGYVISIEADNATALIDRATAVNGTFDTNGLLVVQIPDFENPSFTVLLTDDFTGSVGDTADPANVATQFGTVYDAIGIPDEAVDEANLLGSAYGGTDFKYTGSEPILVFRDGSTGDWWAINFAGDTEAYDINALTYPLTDFATDPTATTFGATNPTGPLQNVNDFGTRKKEATVYIQAGFLQIANTEAKSLEVYSINGQRVAAANTAQVNVSNLQSGVYIVRIVDNNGQITTQKFIKQ